MSLPATLKDLEPFNLLPDQVIAELEAEALSQTYHPGGYVFRQHDQPTGYLYVILQGLVEIVALAPGAVEMVVDYREPGSFFGGTPVFTNSPYTAGARAVKETLCLLLPGTRLARITEDYPQLRDYFTRAILSRVRSLYSDLVKEHARPALHQVEAFPFRKRLSEIMTTQVAVCSPEASIEVIAQRMTQAGTGAVLVSDRDNRLRGIITEHDLVAKVLAKQSANQPATAAVEVMTAEPLTLPPATYMYEAVTFMLRHRIRHLPVLTEGEVVGLVTLHELMKFRGQNAMLLLGGVKEARTLGELARIKQEIVKIAKALLSEGRSPGEAMEVISYLHHGILQRGFELVLEALRDQGLTPPALRYSFFLMGSGGRREMLLDPDQDHGLIIEDYPPEQHAEVAGFFGPLARQLVAAYAEIGYPRCKGGVMASNPLWQGSLSQWRQRLTDWIKVPEPQKVRYSNNFFDFSPLAGDDRLCFELRGIVHRLVAESPLFLYHLMELNFQHKVPLGLLGGFTIEKEGEYQGMVPTKQTGSLFIVDCLRIFSLEQQLDATSTSERLQELVRRKVFNRESAEHIQAAFQAFTYLRLRQEISRIEAGLAPTHYIDPTTLGKNERDLLKEAFRAAGKLQDSTRRHFARLVH